VFSEIAYLFHECIYFSPSLEPLSFLQRYSFLRLALSRIHTLSLAHAKEDNLPQLIVQIPLQYFLSLLEHYYPLSCRLCSAQIQASQSQSVQTMQLLCNHQFHLAAVFLEDLDLQVALDH
jgi:hypothetical protein